MADIKNLDIFFRDNPNPMWVYDPTDLSIQEVNKSALELYEYSREEMLNLTISDLRPPEEVSKLKDYLAKGNKDFNNSRIWKHQKKNGEYLFVRVLSSSTSVETKQHKLVVVQDVTRKIEYREKYRMLYKHSLDGIMLTNPNGDILEANKAACDILGRTEEEIIALGRDGIVVKDEKLEKALGERTETGQFSGELTYIHKSGRKIPVEITTSVFTNYAGEKRTSLIFRDISDQKQTQQALQHEKEFSDATINSMPGIFFVLNEEGRVVQWNENSTEVFGLSDQQIEGEPAVNFVHEEDKELVVKEIKKVFETGSTAVELKLDTANDTTSIYQFVANRIFQDDRTYVVGSGIDITQQKELEDKISSLLEQESKQRKKAETDRDKLAAIYENTPSPKCMLEGPEFRLTIANESYRKIIGQQDIIGKKLVDVIPTLLEQGYIEVLNKVYQTGEAYVGYKDPVEIVKNDPGATQEYIFNMIFQPLFDNTGEVYGIFVEAVDISEQLQYQQKLEESLKEKETLLAEIHHRVKNNLAIVSSMLELQAMESTEQPLKTAFKTGQQRIQTIALIHELLYQSESLSQVDFKRNIERLISSLREVYDASHKIKVQLESDPIELNVNQAIPCALIINEIVTNAYKHAFEGRESGNIAIQTREKNGMIHLTISDDGTGIPEDLDLNKSTSLGITLIKLLQQQLEANFELTRENGTKVTLSFKKANINGIGSNLYE